MFFKVMKDMVDEYRGIDVEARNRDARETREKKEKEYKEKNFVSRSIKRYILIIGAIYLIYGGSSAVLEFRGGHIGGGIVTVMQIVLAAAGTVFVHIPGKTVQKIGCGLFAGFVAIQAIRTFVILA